MFRSKYNRGPSIFDGDRWNEIWDTIARNKRRSIMTAMGVFWGVFMLVVLMGVGMGLERYFNKAVGGMSTNALYFMSDQTSIPYEGMPALRWWNLTTDDIDAIRKEVSEAQYVSGIRFGTSANFTRGEQSDSYSIMGYSADYQKINPSEILYGRFINELDMSDKRKVCLIGEQVWKDLFPGREDPIGEKVLMNNISLTVVGVITSSSNISFSNTDTSVVLPITLIQQLYGGENYIHMLTVMGYDDTDAKALEDKCRQIIAARHIISPDDRKAIRVLDSSEMFGRIQGLLTGVNLLTWIVGLGTMLAGIVGISNIMLVTVRERTREIGVRRALGATPMMIISQILSESFILTFISGLLALALGVGLLSMVDKMLPLLIGDELSCQISFGLGMGALFIIIAGSLLAGVIPANRAVQIKAVDAIRDE